MKTKLYKLFDDILSKILIFSIMSLILIGSGIPQLLYAITKAVAGLNGGLS